MTGLEGLSSDILEEGFIKCFAPFHYFQWFLGTVRVDMKSRFVVISTFYQKLYSYMFSVCITSSALYFDSFYEYYFHDYSALYSIHSIGNVVQYLCVICNIMHVKQFRPNDNIELYLILQKIDRCLHLDGQKFVYERHFRINMIGVVIFSIAYMICFSIHIYSIVEFPLLTIFMGLGVTAVQIEFLAMASTVYFLATRLRFLNKLINTRLNNEITLKPTAFNSILQLIWRDESLTETASVINYDEDSILTSFKFIVEGIKVVCEVYSFQVVLLFSAVYLSTLVVIEGITLGYHTKHITIETAVTMIIIWVLFYVIAVIYLSVICELCVLQVRDTKTLCTEVLQKNHEGPIHDTAKAIIRLISWHTPKFTVYSVISVDLSLPVRLLRLIATNTIVLMQFTFL